MSMWEKTILVIDDDQQILNLVETLFQQEGARVVTSLDPEAALRLLYRHQPDLVIVDLMMPVMNGLELARRIRELSAVPIMMLTAVNSDQETVRALRIGCDDYVTKPFMPNVLIARAKVLLRRSEAEESRTLPSPMTTAIC
jgi:DNA-binding response OmpR family regulator